MISSEFISTGDDSGNVSTEKDSKDDSKDDLKNESKDDSKDDSLDNSKDDSRDVSREASSSEMDPVEKIRRYLEQKLGLSGSYESVDHGNVQVKIDDEIQNLIY